MSDITSKEVKSIKPKLEKLKKSIEETITGLDSLDVSDSLSHEERDDRRNQIRKSVSSGEMTKDEAAEAYGVSRWTVDQACNADPTTRPNTVEHYMKTVALLMEGKTLKQIAKQLERTEAWAAKMKKAAKDAGIKLPK